MSGRVALDLAAERLAEALERQTYLVALAAVRGQDPASVTPVPRFAQVSDLASRIVVAREELARALECYALAIATSTADSVQHDRARAKLDEGTTG